MQAKLEDVIETVMSLPLESKMKLAELLQKNMVEQQEAANSPISEADELEGYARVQALMSKTDELEGHARVQALYGAGETEKADRLKHFLDTLNAYAEIDEPDIEAEDIYRERERNVAT